MKNQLFKRLITITATGLACAAILSGNPVIPNTLHSYTKTGMAFIGTTESDTYDNVDENSDTNTTPEMIPQHDNDENPKPLH